MSVDEIGVEKTKGELVVFLGICDENKETPVVVIVGASLTVMVLSSKNSLFGPIIEEISKQVSQITSSVDQSD